MTPTTEGSSVQASTNVHWTWGDQLNTYRFWGLAAFFVCVFTTRQMISLGAHYYRQELLLTDYQVGVFFSLPLISSVLGFLVAWLAVQWQTKLVLCVMAVLEVIGVLLLTSGIIFTFSVHLPAMYCGAILVGLASGTVVVSVPAILAGGRGGAPALVVAFGVIFTADRLMQFVLPVALNAVLQMFGFHFSALLQIALAVLGLLFLFPVRHALFNGPPPLRGMPLEPQYRHPLVVALLCFVPIFNLFYIYYWIYRAHAEVKRLSPRGGLLAPGIAVLVALFVPLMPAVMLTTLVLELNRRAAEREARAYASPVAAFVVTFLFWPAAMGVVQAAMNAAMKATPIIEDDDEEWPRRRRTIGPNDAIQE